jgi:hypothetical protein
VSSRNGVDIGDVADVLRGKSAVSRCSRYGCREDGNKTGNTHGRAFRTALDTNRIVSYVVTHEDLNSHDKVGRES